METRKWCVGQKLNDNVAARVELVRRMCLGWKDTSVLVKDTCGSSRCYKCPEFMTHASRVVADQPELVIHYLLSSQLPATFAAWSYKNLYRDNLAVEKSVTARRMLINRT